MKINSHHKTGQSASALLVVMIMAAILTMVTFAGGQRTAALEQELRLLESKQKARLEKLNSGVNTNLTKHGQSTRH